MSEIAVRTTATAGVVLTVLTHVNRGKVDDAIALFAEEFRFNDYGIGLEFKDKGRLAEFFRKNRELFPDAELQTDTIFLRGDRVVAEWTLRATLVEPFFGGMSRKVPISLHGVSIVRTKNGKITDWTDYYDGMTSRRTALAAQFEEWVDL